jgi:hypothetical protein
VSAAQLIHQDSGNCEWYTPTEIVDAARHVLGGVIDLDPASSEIANKRVRAAQYYDHDGLTRLWAGRVWLNHPFSREGNPRWVAKAVEAHAAGCEVAMICFAATSERWFRPLMDFPQCYLSPRTNYYLPTGEKKRGVTKGSVVTYMGPNFYQFAYRFSQMGVVMQPVRARA